MEENMKKPPGVTPGWNDPPTLAYDPKSVTNKPSRLSNKRVAFPLSNNVIVNSMNPGAIPAPASLGYMPSHMSSVQTSITTDQSCTVQNVPTTSNQSLPPVACNVTQNICNDNNARNLSNTSYND